MRAIDVQDRHAIDGRGLVGARAPAVDHVIGTDDQRDIDRPEIVVDLVHVEDQVMGTPASASSTFIWPGIRPATGWMANFTSTLAARSSLTSSVRASAAHGLPPSHSRGRSPRSPNSAWLRRTGAGGARPGFTEVAEQHIGQAAVHRLGHQQRQQRAGRAHNHARDHQRGVAQRIALQPDRQPVKGIVERDDHRHVGAADQQGSWRCRTAAPWRRIRRSAMAPALGRSRPAHPARARRE
ncbi:unnamed protein product [Acanthosepion pharaonis]|uniref:Uncharacterized protein n=1 Tax=Acanthosepion pharaonis TaxID=158019 RepID=A0A812DKS4_ACAPH|nr:unnamed protein product [Sepia pharaonis]